MLPKLLILAAFTAATLLAADPVKEQDALMRSLERLVPQNAAHADGYRSRIAFVRTDQGIKVTLTEAGPDRTVTQTFIMPGDCAKTEDCVFKRTDGIVEFHGPGGGDYYYNLGPYDVSVAHEIVDKLNRLKVSASAQHNPPKQ